MNPINEFFDHVYIRTIDLNNDRKRTIDERIRGVQFEFFDKVDVTRDYYRQFKYVADFPDSIFDAHNIDRHYSKMWSKGQYGCFANSVELMEDAKKNCYDKVLVLEDDVVFSKNVFSVFNKAIKELPDDWDIIFFGYKNSKYNSKFFQHIKYWYKKINKNAKWVVPLKYSKHLRFLPNQFGGGFAYGLSKNGTNKILNYQSPHRELGDVLFSKLTKDPDFKMFSIHPHIAKEAGFISTTQSNW